MLLQPNSRACVSTMATTATNHNNNSHAMFGSLPLSLTPQQKPMAMPMPMRHFAAAAYGNHNGGGGGGRGGGGRGGGGRGGGGGGGGRGGGGRGGGMNKHNNDKKLTLKLCFTPDDLDPENDDEDDEDELLTIQGNDNLQQIRRKVAKALGWELEECEELEFYDEKEEEWKEITNASQLVAAAGNSKKPLNIRMPDAFDELDDDEGLHFGDDSDDDDAFKYDDDVGDDDNDLGFSNKIRELVTDLKTEGWSRPSNETGNLEKAEGGESGKSCKGWVLERAQTDQELQSLLLSQPGALDHIVQCLGYEFVWTMTTATTMMEAEIVDQDSDDDADEVDSTQVNGENSNSK